MSRSRAGFTLFELMLVMAVIIVAAAISMPAIQAMLDDGHLKAARDLVQSRWADIRGRAIEESRPYKFSVAYGTGKFKIEPDDSDSGAASDDNTTPPLVEEKELPTGIVFSKAESSGNNTGSGSLGPAGSGGGYDTLAVYLEDGTARDDAQLMFGKQGHEPIGLKLRALTGSVSVVEASKDNGR